MEYTGSSRFATPLRRLGTAAVAAGVFGCGGGGTNSGGPGPNPTTDTIEKASPSGDNQAGSPGQQLPQPLRVVVRSGNTVVTGKTITWQPSGGGVNPTSSTTGSDGIATTTVTLPLSGTITIEASASGTSGSPLSFTALVAETIATVQVVNNRFDPEVVAIRAGGSVSFDWPAGSSQHNLIPDDGRSVPSEPTIRNGPVSVTVQFPTAGDYYYHCNVHGSTRSGMYGRVVVVP